MRIRTTLTTTSPQGAIDKFKSTYRYDSNIGEIFNRITNRTYNSLNVKGYKQPISLTFNGVEYSLQYPRLCWLLYYGEFIPEGLQTDHINNILTDNRIQNLQLVSNTKNSYKRKLAKVGKGSKYKGVSYSIDITDGIEYPNYVAAIGKDTKVIKIGRFKDNAELAAKFYDAANRFLFKEMYYTNFPEIWIPPADIETLREWVKQLKKPRPSPSEMEGVKILGELLERYGYPNLWKTMPISSGAI
jgi:hypothetical protein